MSGVYCLSEGKVLKQENLADYWLCFRGGKGPYSWRRDMLNYIVQQILN